MILSNFIGILLESAIKVMLSRHQKRLEKSEERSSLYLVTSTLQDGGIQSRSSELRSFGLFLGYLRVFVSTC